MSNGHNHVRKLASHDAAIRLRRTAIEACKTAAALPSSGSVVPCSGGDRRRAAVTRFIVALGLPTEVPDTGDLDRWASETIQAHRPSPPRFSIQCWSRRYGLSLHGFDGWLTSPCDHLDTTSSLAGSSTGRKGHAIVLKALRSLTHEDTPPGRHPWPSGWRCVRHSGHAPWCQRAGTSVNFWIRRFSGLSGVTSVT
jgi:hypothetical protein